MPGTAVPAVLSALVASATAAAPDGTTVMYGPAVEGQFGDYVCIGSAEQGPGVVNQETITDYGLVSPMETFDIVSEAVAWQADTDIESCVGRAAALVDAISAGLRTNPTLDGVVMLAQLIATDYTTSQTTKGALVVAQFTIRVQASKQ